MFTQLYNKCLKLAAHKNSNYFLGAISFIESSFFPIPPDVMIAPMAIAKNGNF
jgi:membrane protein YqaA with SNARE-associated domain